MTILAKTGVSGHEVDLYMHTRQVLAAAKLLFGDKCGPTRLGKAWLRFFRIDQAYWEVFILTLYFAAIFHDFGKANNGFQHAVRRSGRQIIRHEHLSGLLLYKEPWKSWLEDLSIIDFEILLAAIISHHLNAKKETFCKPMMEQWATLSFEMTAPEMKACWDLVREVAGVVPPEVEADHWIWEKSKVYESRRRFSKDAYVFFAELDPNSQRHRLLAALKAGLICCDALGSASMRESLSMETFVGKCFKDDPLTPEWISTHVLNPRISEIEKRSGSPFRWHDFQDAIAGLGERALLLSACGTGKTLAAWKWIQAQLKRLDATRVMFLYPTRATATEGFRDYVSWVGEAPAALMHGTSAFDLLDMFESNDDFRQKEDYRVRERLYALGYWPKQVYSATVDSFLAFMRNQYASICMLPTFCDSVIVIDEVHSFDRNMFTALERFLKFFDLPVLCMTATLSNDRKNVLANECNLVLFPQEEDASEAIALQAGWPRYNLLEVEIGDAAHLVVRELSEGKKVLWVVNTVKRCQNIAHYLEKLLGVSSNQTVVCYHSRFRLKDRKSRHEELIRRFHDGVGPLLAVTTQVCEMSLDIDADTLVTEAAPVASIIQRMGRCCREQIPKGGRTGLVAWYMPEGSKPYLSDEIAQGMAFLKAMTARNATICLSELGQYLEDMDVLNPFSKDGYTGFLDCGMYAMAHDESFRDTLEFTRDCVLDGDVDEYLQLKNNHSDDSIGLLLPVPARFVERDARLGHRVYKASSRNYSTVLGFCEWETPDG